MRAVRLLPFPVGLPSYTAAGTSEVSRFSCMKFLGVSGVYDYAGLPQGSRYRPGSCCLPPSGQRRRPDCAFSKLDTQPTYTPVYASAGTSRYPPQNSGPSGSLLLPRKTLPFSASCRFIPALPLYASNSARPLHGSAGASIRSSASAQCAPLNPGRLSGLRAAHSGVIRRRSPDIIRESQVNTWRPEAIYGP